MNLLNDNQLTDVRNMWFKDGALRTRYGLSISNDGYKFTDFSGEIIDHCFCRASGNTYVVEKIGNEFVTINIHAFDVDGYYIGMKYAGFECQIVPLNSTINGKIYDAVAYGSGDVYGIYVNDGILSLDKLEPYAPIVFVSGKGSAATGTDTVGGDLVEGYNLLTNAFRAYYNTDAESTKYYMPKSIAGTITVTYTQGNTKYVWEGIVGQGELTSVGTSRKMTPNRDYIEFSEPLPEIVGPSNNLKVYAHYAETSTDKPNVIPGKIHAWFGGTRSEIYGGTHLFVAGGDEEHINRVHFSGANNALYFSENNYIDVGSPDSAITAFGKQSDMLVFFKNDEIYYTPYVQGNEVSSEDVMAGKVVDTESVQAFFPVTQLSGNIGCDLPQTIRLMQNRLMWADSYGRVWTLIYSNEYSTRNVRAVGGLISRKLKELNLHNAMATTYDNYYMLLIGGDENKAFVLDTEDYGYAYYTSYGSDKKAQNSMGWYAWELPNIPLSFSDERTGEPLIFSKNGGKLYAYSIADGNDTVMDADGNSVETLIPCMLQTKLFDMNATEKTKVFERVYITLGKSPELSGNATYITEQRNYTDSAKIEFEGISDEFTAQFIGGVTLSPNIRSKRFALRLENEGRMYVDGISIYYKV
jgi:hypothetical protein